MNEETVNMTPTEEKHPNSHGPNAHGAYTNKNSNRGGYRPNSSTPKTITVKLTASDVLKSLDKTLGHSYQDQLSEDFLEAINSGDKKLKMEYHRLLLKGVLSVVNEPTIPPEDETKKMSTDELIILAKTLLKDL
jgi:hypothetical protein